MKIFMSLLIKKKKKYGLICLMKIFMSLLKKKKQEIWFNLFNEDIYVSVAKKKKNNEKLVLIY